MSKHGAVILSNVRLLVRYRSSGMRPVELSGLRLMPVTTAQSFTALLRQQQHRNFASSTHSEDDEGRKKHDKHKKETSPASELVQKSEPSSQAKVVWERCEEGDNCNQIVPNIPGLNLARRAQRFKRKQKHKRMMQTYLTYRAKMNAENQKHRQAENKTVKAKVEAREKAQAAELVAREKSAKSVVAVARPKPRALATTTTKTTTTTTTLTSPAASSSTSTSSSSSRSTAAATTANMPNDQNLWDIIMSWSLFKRKKSDEEKDKHNEK
ncbi:hypothetical protein KR222_011541 [Zaprionus bogoriensis]|nr:hypothetical protein KR222_011541 [Zaprionus bogoriensis]